MSNVDISYLRVCNALMKSKSMGIENKGSVVGDRETLIQIDQMREC